MVNVNLACLSLGLGYAFGFNEHLQKELNFDILWMLKKIKKTLKNVLAH